MADTTKWHRLSEIDPDAKTATCQICGPNTFIRPGRGTTKWKCAVRLRERKRERNRRHRRSVLISSGASRVERDAIGASQGWRCAICAIKVSTDPVLDHCHQTGAIRGVLCRRCNVGIGMLNDDPNLLRAALDYLAR